MQIPPELKCRTHKLALVPDQAGTLEDAGALKCEAGCRVPVRNGIPRFVKQSNYAAGFGLQWNAFRKTQLDSYTGTSISRDRLRRCLGGSLEIVRGRSVLEVGCGAGRFTEILLAAGARVFACDLSEAVEANYENCRHWPDYFVCQADVLHLPVTAQSFDIVLCLGVIQHTPDPELTISTLGNFVKPGGSLVIDHYARNYPYTASRKLLRSLLIRLPPRVSKGVAITIARALLPLHRILWRQTKGFGRLRTYLARISPLVDYYGAYPQLNSRMLSEWAVLDTHDTLTDVYKHFRSVEEIRTSLLSSGFVDVESWEGGNGVEARATRAV